VVGGVEPLRGRFDGVITVDLRRMDKLLSIDPESRTATFEAGIRGPAIEAALSVHGFTLGHLPQSHQQATLGGYIATRSAARPIWPSRSMSRLRRGPSMLAVKRPALPPVPSCWTSLLAVKAFLA
jgi:hypothetical protein